MNDNEDLELQALQRQLDDAFETTRPRAGFEDALWSRMQARRSLWTRLQDFFSGLIDSIREAPAVPATAVAVVLIVAIGVGIVSLARFHPGSGASSTAGLATQQQPVDGQFRPSGAFGPLPPPTLRDVSVPKTSGGPSGTQPATAVYGGLAKLVWAGTLKVSMSTAPVFPDNYPLDAGTALARLLRAIPEPPGQSGTFAGDGFTLTVSRDSFQLTVDPAALPAAGATPEFTANGFLIDHGLVPAWPYVVVTENSAEVTRVRYLRQFTVPTYGPAFAIDATGERTGLEVDLRNARPFQVEGPLPLNMSSSDYPIITADQAVRAALASPSTAPATIQPIPTVRLTSAELVYSVAGFTESTYYEPAFLFSGTFNLNGVTYVKRVLVPAVVPSQLSS